MKRFFYDDDIEEMTKFHTFRGSKGETLIGCSFRAKDGFEFSTVYTPEEWPFAEKELLAMGVKGIEPSLFDGSGVGTKNTAE